MAETGIYESDVIEALAVAKEYSADAFAVAFLAAVERSPEVATDHETMVSWFAVAVQNGFYRGWNAPRGDRA